jgi:hypothetical protein
MANFTLTKNTNYPAGNGQVAGDSGNIRTIPQPGQATGPKLTDGTQQSATTATADSTVPGLGNCMTAAMVSTYGPAGNALGYSILGE